jgi:predicted ribosome quality control (RQC) complex YloA/Tae2 family protein
VSNGARFDSLLVRHLAEELDRLLRGRSIRLRALSGAAHSVRLDIAPGELLLLDLHPATRGVRMEPADAPPGGAARLRVESVRALPDERVLRFELLGGNRFREESRSLVVEMIPARENAFELDAAGRTLQLLRGLHDPARRLAPGATYVPPAPTGRLLPRDAGDEERRRLAGAWADALAALPGGERRAAYLSTFAYAGPVNAGWVLGDASGEGTPPGALEGAFARWWELVHAPGRPHLIDVRGARQPYPHALGQEGAEALPGLLGGFARAAAAPVESPETRGAPPSDLVERAEKRLASARRRLEHLLEERDRSTGSDLLRGRADLILANLHLLERGAERAILPGFAGEEVEVELDPGRAPAENADRLYAEARRMDRARDRLPLLIETAEAEVRRREGALERARAGEEVVEAESGRRRGKAAPSTEEALPYRSYRTSGGLEVRVGRSARANDRLTFGHSDPRDVWMHARSVGGSHVILRWSRDEAPPARDLEEAAVLAALHSKARGSGVVAVDWTQRRHVRKPRGAPPGAVTPGRTRTVFVEPDGAVEERMRREAE